MMTNSVAQSRANAYQRRGSGWSGALAARAADSVWFTVSVLLTNTQGVTATNAAERLWRRTVGFSTNEDRVARQNSSLTVADEAGN
jgi:hypothetical protein